MRRRRLLGVVDDQQLAARLEPALDPVVRIGDDRRAARRELERATRRRRVDGRVRTARDAEVDACGRDRPREDVERHVADQPRVAGVAAEVAPAEREVDVGQRVATARRPSPPSSRGGTCRRSRRRRRPAPSRRPAARRTRGRRPRRRPAPRRAPSSRSRSRPPSEFERTSVVLGRIGVVVPVEAGVHASELGQAHRHVAVVEDDRHAEPLAQRGRDPAQVRHGTVKTTTASGRSRSTSRSRCRRQRGVTQRQISSRVIRSP